MGKSYKERPDKWKRQLQKKSKKQKWQKGNWESKNKSYSPFDDPQEYHESFS